MDPVQIRQLNEDIASAERSASVCARSAETDEAAAAQQTGYDRDCSLWHSTRARKSEARWLAKAAALRAQLPQQPLPMVARGGI